MALSRETISQIAQKTADEIVERVLSFHPCEIEVRGKKFEGEYCDSDYDLYHHTSIKKLPLIVLEQALKPSDDPFHDGVVNFTLNPNFHRFGSIRLTFDRDKAGKEIPLKKMCYIDNRELTNIVDDIQEERREKDNPGIWRIEHEVGAEPPIYKPECKRFTTSRVPLKLVKKVEYYLPWRPGDDTIGSNVSPCHGLWSIWDTGLYGALERIQEEIKQTKSFAQSLNVPFHVKTCYPYASLDRDDYIVFDEENIKRLENGEQPIIKNQWLVKPPEARCICPSEKENKE